MKHGLLLINLGTPDNPGIAAVKPYLHRFLTDKRVIDIPAFLRYILVYGLIVPFRAKNSAHAYQSIWTSDGSPLLYHSKELALGLQKKAPAHYQVALGMRYGNPSIESALDELKACSSVVILPLYPQYSSAATGSSIEETLRLMSKKHVIPSLRIIRDFYHHPAYIKAQAELIRAHLKPSAHLLFSYHGIPERHIIKSGCATVCSNACPPPSTSSLGCYRAQCYQTSALLAQELELKPEQYSTAFQSRLGKTPWIKPYTDELLTELSTQGIKELAIACPSFVADCLETIEEIGIRGQAQWRSLGGTDASLIPCMNSNPAWIDAIWELVLNH